MKINDKSPTKLIKFLYEGRILPGHSGIMLLKKIGEATGNYAKLKYYLDRNPVIMRQAQQNREIIEFRRLENPFELISREDARQYLSGPLQLGNVNQHDDMFGMHPDDLSMPVILAGRVGSGKSNLNKQLITEILGSDSKANIIIPDLKLEYRALTRMCPNIRVIGCNELKTNPLEPKPWMGLTEYIIFFAQVFTRQNWILATSENILIETLEYIYRKRMVYDGSQNWPTMMDLFRVISKRLESEKSFRYRDVLMLLQNRIYPYLHCPVFNCRKGIPDEYWRSENIVLELDEGFTDNMYSFIVSYLVGLNYRYNKKHGLSGSKLRTLFIIDEGRVLFDANRNVSDFGESYIIELSTRTRDHGIGYVIASQESASFNQTIRANAYTKFAFPLTDGADRDFVKESFGLDQDQADYLFKLPKHGICVVRYGGYERPFLLGVPHVDMGSAVTDQELEIFMEGFYRKIHRDIKIPDTAIKLASAQSPPPFAMALIHFLSQKPFTKSSDLKNASGLKSQAEVNKAISLLESNGYVHRRPYQVSKKGRKAHFAVLTRKAYQEFGLKPIQGKGDFEHQLYQHLVCKRLQSNGLNAQIEGRIQGSNKSIDVLSWNADDQIVAYEITLHLKNLIENITQDIESGATQVVVVCQNQMGLEKVRTIVESDDNLAEFREQVTFSLISEYFN
ncbi:uncharacterized protein Dvar_51480 [Desulfosarcina variabilis str. Montpellier]|uniref:ATP-binding protein n=1 Tax=Desulfosarcina variabilis TaxID=2300 RepID=UPI003AFB31C7